MSGLTGSGFGLDIDTKNRIAPTHNGDHDRFAHYVQEDDMMNGLVFGKSVVALCGKVWVPEQDGSRFPMCPACKDIFDSIFNANEE